MNDLISVFKQQFPVNFTYYSQDKAFQIRDKDITKGQGYNIQVSQGKRFFYAKIEFESFSNNLKIHVEKQQKVNNHLLSELVIKHPDFKASVESQHIQNIANQEIEKVDNWWFNFEYKLDINSDVSSVKFADILLAYILLLFPYEFEGEEEGGRIEVTTSRYERSRGNRALCLAFHGYNCKACNLNMREEYAGLSNDFIHVHHVNPISKAGNGRLDPLNDMVPLCPNCHGVAHLKDPPYTVVEIAQMINRKNG